MSGHHGRAINHGKSRHLGRFTLAFLDPDCRQPEGRIGGLGADQLCRGAARVDGQVHARVGIALADHGPAQGQPVRAGLELQVVADVHRRRQETHVLCKLLAHSLDSGQQVALARLVDQRDQPVADLQAERVDWHEVIPGRLGVRLRGLGRARRRSLCSLAIALAHPPCAVAEAPCNRQEDEVRHARNHPQRADHTGRDRQHPRRVEHLAGNLAADVLVLADTRDHHRCGHRDQQRRDLRHQRVAHRQQDVAVRGLCGGEVVLRHADHEAADDVDEQDQQACHRVAAHEFAGTVHRAKELCLFTHFEAPPLGFLVVDQAGAQVGIDGHLLAGHRIQREARADLGDAFGALGHHDEVDDHQNRKHDQSDREVATDQEVTERLDHRTRRAGAGVPFEQHHACGRDVERQAQQGRQQDDRRERRKVERLDHVGRHHHHHQRHGNVEGEQDVERKRRQRQHHHRQDHHHHQRRHHRAHSLGVGAQHGLHPRNQGIHSKSSMSGTGVWCGSSSAGTSSSGSAAGMATCPLMAARNW